MAPHTASESDNGVAPLSRVGRGLLQFDVHEFDEVESTNILVKAAIEAGEPEGYVVRAAVQTGGYGRQGRSWESPRGGLYFSILLRPQEAGVPLQQLPTLGLMAALAVRDAVAQVEPSQNPQVKWPNDVLEANEKIAGISCETHAGAVCIGIGVDREPSLLSAILDSFATRYETWLREGFELFQDEFNAHHALVGRQIRIADIYGNVLADGVARMVDSQGRLGVEQPTGTVLVSSGEAHIQ